MGLGVGVELQVVGILIRGGVARLGAEKSNKPANSKMMLKVNVGATPICFPDAAI